MRHQTSLPRLTSRIPLTLFLLFVFSFGTLRAQQGENIAERNYSVRIGVLVGVERAALLPKGSYHVANSGGLALSTLIANKAYYVEQIEGRHGGHVYRLVVRELDIHEEDNAIIFAKAASQAYGLPTKAIRMPEDVAAGREPRLLITVGEFDTIEAARAYKDQLKNDTIRFIYEEKHVSQEGRIIIRDANGSLVASDVDMLKLVPKDMEDDSIHLMSLKVGEKPSTKSLEGARHYAGIIELRIDHGSKLTAVNRLWLEYYLYGVVNSELGPGSPLEALKAQAVVARSTAVARIEKGIVSDNELFDFGDTQMQQSYGGKATDSEIVRRAVDSTRGEILVWEGKAIEAVYSHSCGGVISSAGDMWDSKQLRYFIRKADRLTDNSVGDLSSSTRAADWIDSEPSGFCNPDQPGFPEFAKKNYRWEKTLSASEVSKVFDKGYGTGTVKDIVVEKRSGAGRVRVLRVVGSKKTIRIDREMNIRAALGGLKSSFFVVSTSRDASGNLSAEIRGGGYGHGVGMCQLGAIMMSKKNYTYRQILGHYFVDVKIRRLYG